MNDPVNDVLNGDSQGCILCGDGLYVLSQLGEMDVAMVFADPPDNLGLPYDGFVDKQSVTNYMDMLCKLAKLSILHSRVTWLSIYHRHAPSVAGYIQELVNNPFGFDSTIAKRKLHLRQLIWSFTFGQHQQKDCGNNYRPLLRIAPADFEWHTDRIRVQSERQAKGDKRADPRGRVPGDVWEFSRVCGNFHERQAWHPTQHPEALLERAILMSTNPGDLVVDPFSGTGTTCAMARRLGRRYIGIDQSPEYVRRSLERVNAESWPLFAGAVNE